MILSDIATIRPGYHVRGKLSPLPEGNLAIVQMSDIQPDGAIGFAGLTRIEAAKINPNHLLKHGDILLTNRGHKNQGVLVDCEVSDTVAASHFFRIRPKSLALSSDYLSWYLNQPAAQSILARYKKSSSIPLLSREGVENLPIPIPPLEEQEKIAAIGTLLGEEIKILEELSEKRKRLVSAQLLSKVSSYQNGESNV